MMGKEGETEWCDPVSTRKGTEMRLRHCWIPPDPVEVEHQLALFKCLCILFLFFIFISLFVPRSAPPGERKTGEQKPGSTKKRANKTRANKKGALIYFRPSNSHENNKYVQLYVGGLIRPNRVGLIFRFGQIT